MYMCIYKYIHMYIYLYMYMFFHNGTKKRIAAAELSMRILRDANVENSTLHVFAA